MLLLCGALSGSCWKPGAAAQVWGGEEYSGTSPSPPLQRQLRRPTGPRRRKRQKVPARKRQSPALLSHRPGSQSRREALASSSGGAGLHPGWGPGPTTNVSCPQGGLLDSEDDPHPSSSLHPKRLPSACGMGARDKPSTRALTFTNVIKVQWGTHLGKCPKHGPGGSSWRRPALSRLRRLESKPQAGEVLASQVWAGESAPGCRLAYGTAKLGQDRSLQPRLGHGLGLRTHSPLCRARPVSRRRWVLLVRVALGGFLVESWARLGCFLLTFLRLCACSEAVREEILWEGGRLVRLGPQSTLGNKVRVEVWAGW